MCDVHSPSEIPLWNYNKRNKYKSEAINTADPVLCTMCISTVFQHAVVHLGCLGVRSNQNGLQPKQNY